MRYLIYGRPHNYFFTFKIITDQSNTIFNDNYNFYILIFTLKVFGTSSPV